MPLYVVPVYAVSDMWINNKKIRTELNKVFFFLQVVRWYETLHIPHYSVSREAEDLIRGLLNDSKVRLGSNSGADEIKRQPFFNGINFSEMLRTQRAPWRPEIMHETDTSNFDPIDPDRLLNDNSDSDNDESGGRRNNKDSHGFYEFTFRRFFDDGGHPLPLAEYRSSAHPALSSGSSSAGTSSIAPDPVYV